LCSVDRASLYNLVNKANLVQNLFLVYLFLVYLSISTCFGRLCAHHQEKQLCLCDTWYLLFCTDDCLVCRVEFHFSWWWAHSHPKHVEINKYTKNKYTKNKLCTELVFIYQLLNICPPALSCENFRVRCHTNSITCPKCTQTSIWKCSNNKRTLRKFPRISFMISHSYITCSGIKWHCSVSGYRYSSKLIALCV
jgi:hypothetical protein